VLLEKAILSVIAEISEDDASEVSGACILKKLQQKFEVSEEAIQPHLESLKEREILVANYRDDIYYSYKVGLVRRWVKKNYPLLRITREVRA
jgi:DNA-binding transcriptional ArsR family regulator